jgi:hypothetical protein
MSIIYSGSRLTPLQEELEVEVLRELYDLLYEMLLQHWAFFCAPQNANALRFVLNAFLKAINQPDINLFRQSVKGVAP